MGSLHELHDTNIFTKYEDKIEKKNNNYDNNNKYQFLSRKHYNTNIIITLKTINRELQV